MSGKMIFGLIQLVFFGFVAYTLIARPKWFQGFLESQKKRRQEERKLDEPVDLGLSSRAEASSERDAGADCESK